LFDVIKKQIETNNMLPHQLIFWNTWINKTSWESCV